MLKSSFVFIFLHVSVFTFLPYFCVQFSPVFHATNTGMRWLASCHRQFWFGKKISLSVIVIIRGEKAPVIALLVCNHKHLLHIFPPVGYKNKVNTAVIVMQILFEFLSLMPGFKLIIGLQKTFSCTNWENRVQPSRKFFQETWVQVGVY